MAGCECNARARRCDGRDMRRGAETRSESSSHFIFTQASKFRILEGREWPNPTPLFESRVKCSAVRIRDVIVMLLKLVMNLKGRESERVDRVPPL